jgi:hypothetical protein
MLCLVSWIRTLLFLAALGGLLWDLNETRYVPLDQPKQSAAEDYPHLIWLNQPPRTSSADGAKADVGYGCSQGANHAAPSSSSPASR